MAATSFASFRVFGVHVQCTDPLLVAALVSDHLNLLITDHLI